MGLYGWIFYMLCGLMFFLIISIIDNKFSVTKIEKLVISIILMMIVGGYCFRLGINYSDNIFLIYVFLMIYDIIYNSYFIERDFFDKNEKNIEYYIVLIIVGFIVNQEFINNVTEVFLTGEDLRIVLWFLSLIFVYNFIQKKNILSNNKEIKDKYMSTQTVLVNYAKLKHRFYDSCDFSDKEISNIVFAIMIYENSKRSKILRNYDYFMFRLNGNKKKLGIMQVESDKFISDVESIEITYKKLEKLYNKKDSKSTRNTKNKVYEVIEKYTDNPEYIKYIFDIIKKF